jgi:hypothetical protein
MSPSDLEKLSEDYENQIKQIKDGIYRIGWAMRGSLSYEDLFYRITRDDHEVLNNIMKDNIEATNKTGLSIL